jgi:hypothetical protein
MRSRQANACDQRAEAWGCSQRVEDGPRSQPQELPRSLLVGALETVESSNTRPVLSGSGRFVAFESEASNLVCGNDAVRMSGYQPAD